MKRSIQHGGNLHEAAQRYAIPYDAWLDLSTGINPHGYPVPPVPADAWRRLPDDGDGLAERAAQYYGAPDPAHVLPVAGSQAAIRALPTMLVRGKVGIAPLTYGEYAPAFARGAAAPGLREPRPRRGGELAELRRQHPSSARPGRPRRRQRPAQHRVRAHR